MNLHKNKAEFEGIVLSVADSLKILNPAKIEKDYYLTLFLKTLIQSQNGVVFKGGTSLSKCYKIIDRFSEDIDLNFVTASLQEKQELVKTMKATIDQLELQLVNPERIRDMHEVNQYFIAYPRIFKDKTIKQFVIAETIAHIKSFPTEIKEISSIIHDFLKANNASTEIEKYELHPFNLQVQTLDRTFIDKTYALADYAVSAALTNNSRHIYDLYRLYPEIKFDDKFKALISDVIKVRKGLVGSHSLRPGVNLQQELQKIVDDRVFEIDYKTKTLPLLYKPVPYSEVITVISKIINDGYFNIKNNIGTLNKF